MARHAAGVLAAACPDNVEVIILHSPFKPYWRFPKFAGDMQKMLVDYRLPFEAAGQSRKQQFAATAFITDLIPLTLKDIAWPERRNVHVSTPLPRFTEVLVLALGLIPLPAEKGDSLETNQTSKESSGLAKDAWRQEKLTIHVFVALLASLLVLSYTRIILNKIYSKRSALDCVFPFFIIA